MSLRHPVGPSCESLFKYLGLSYKSLFKYVGLFSMSRVTIDKATLRPVHNRSLLWVPSLYVQLFLYI